MLTEARRAWRRSARLNRNWHPGAPYPLAVRILGLALIAAGGILMTLTLLRFPAEGSGTPLPTNPPSSQKVLTGGPYRYVRNPLYVSYVPAIAGQALLLSRPVLLIYAAALLAFLIAFVRLYEEPTLTKRYGTQQTGQPGESGNVDADHALAWRGPRWRNSRGRRSRHC
jgi:protein-S-isoprenylcysteine O-methyltransferase Ste14